MHRYVCPVCLKRFSARDKRRRFCSKRCQGKWLGLTHGFHRRPRINWDTAIAWSAI